MGKQKKPFYKKIWFILLLLIILIVGFTEGKEAEKTKINISQANINDETKFIKEIDDYEIVEIEDISIGVIKRYCLHVLVNQEANIEQLKILSKKITENFKKEKSFNALVLGFYDYKEYVGFGYILGKVEYAPFSDWAKASDVKAGEYSTMDYKFDLREKDWSKRLTQEEVDIYKYWHELYQSKADLNSTDLPNEDLIDKEIMNRLNISKDKIDEVFQKQLMWMFDDVK